MVVPLFLKIANLLLLMLFPMSWFMPLAKSGLLPYFDLKDEISIITGVQTLWETDFMLAMLVAFFAMVAPIMKTLWLAGLQFNMLKPRAIPVLNFLSKIAMADVFLIALYIVIVKGVGVGRVETAWGLYFFTACVVSSVLITHFTRK
ncbi:paraquat-inducible protein A [Halovulum sp. GXIMD14793]